MLSVLKYISTIKNRKAGLVCKRLTSKMRKTVSSSSSEDEGNFVSGLDPKGISTPNNSSPPQKIKKWVLRAKK